MDKLEERQGIVETRVSELGAVVARVEQNQVHAAELNKLRFDSLDTGVKGVTDTLERFMGRINAIVSGEVKLPQAAQGEKLVADYQEWRKGVDSKLGTIYTSEQRRDIETRLDRHENTLAQVSLVGKIVVVLLSGNALAILGGIAWLVTHSPT